MKTDKLLVKGVAEVDAAETKAEALAVDAVAPAIAVPVAVAAVEVGTVKHHHKTNVKWSTTPRRNGIRSPQRNSKAFAQNARQPSAWRPPPKPET
jgi:hypothetical protein